MALHRLSSFTYEVPNPDGKLHPGQKLSARIPLAGQERRTVVQRSALLLDIRILDHIIVSDRGYFSFADEGIL